VISWWGVRPRWPEYVIVLCIIALGIAGGAALWGPDAARDNDSAGAAGPMGGT
jgi:hypothetical protein